MKSYKAVIERFPDDLRVTPLAWVELADIHYRTKDYKKALELYEVIIHKYPEQEDVVCRALFGLAISNDKLKNYKQALSYYKQCSDRFENHTNPYLAIIGQQARINFNRIRIE